MHCSRWAVPISAGCIATCRPDTQRTRPTAESRDCRNEGRLFQPPFSIEDPSGAPTCCPSARSRRKMADLRSVMLAKASVRQ
jgi:hypothetical protein